MKASASNKEKSTTQGTYSKYSKPPSAKPLTPLESTNVNVNVIGKRAETKKQFPPKPPAKMQFNVEVNMTESKIFQAKKGLQLLKRKMNRTGMSRQKNYSHNDKSQENLVPFNRANSNQELKSEKVNLQKRQSSVTKKQKADQITPNPTKTTKFAQNNQRQKSNVQITQDERPISNTRNFMDLLDQQMKKQQSMIKEKKVQAKPSQAKNKIYDENGIEIILQQCSKGCGRMFNQQTLQKHQKVCQKVFQTKRKAFNSASHRQPEAEGFQPVPCSKIEEKPQKKKNEIPKWKLDSAAFRAGIKQGKNKPLTKQQQALLQMTQQNRICCQFCGRKFSEEAAKKHIPFCQKKSKEISKINTKIKR